MTAPGTTDERGSHELRGTFTGIAVCTGPGGGLASTSGAMAPATHFHAARLPELGDSVLAVTRTFDAETGAPLALELRSFAAAAPGRGVLATATARELLDAPGAIAFAAIELAAPGDAADERRPATLTQLTLSDAAPTDSAARVVADWLRATWEAELAFGSWPALRGSVTAISAGTASADWARTWLTDGEHRVSGDGDFLKVLSEAWLEPLEETQA
ncbi:MAG: hypothetical protein JWM25_1409 [Thermoleophilia bacterium]|nr:hypothetical protein [Thermoleophilia bacterium]MCZ4496826.1 hypothetical protein [Thermoleophilia bacterium]